MACVAKRTAVATPLHHFTRSRLAWFLLNASGTERPCRYSPFSARFLKWAWFARVEHHLLSLGGRFAPTRTQGPAWALARQEGLPMSRTIIPLALAASLAFGGAAALAQSSGGSSSGGAVGGASSGAANSGAAGAAGSAAPGATG